MSKQASNNLSAKKIAVKCLFILLHSIKWMFIFGLIASFLGAGAVFGYVTALVKDDPVRTKELINSKMQENMVTGFIYFDDDNEMIGQLRSDEDRRLVGLNEIPQQVIDAFLSIEDDEFYNHPGINVKGTVRAVLQKFTNDDVQTGGSTITQQLARRVFLSLDVTTSRKAKELFLALRLERFMSKDEILVAYLNKIPFGNGSNGYNVYGIKAAAKGIFDIEDLDDLNIAQAAYLAGLPQRPSAYSAFSSNGTFDEEGYNFAKERQKLVLRRMSEENTITAAEYEEALNFDLKASLAEETKKAYTTYPFLMLEAERKGAEALLHVQNPEMTVEELKTAEGQQLLKDASEYMRSNGYKIYTTINKTIYDMMQDIGHNPEYFTPDDPEKGVEQIGAIMLDNHTGAILGMIEGRSFDVEQLNHATQMLRQPGSTMKPVAAYVPALDLGVIQPGGVIDDTPIILADWTKGYHIPDNWDNKFHGLMTARRALNMSYNVPAIKLFLDDRIGIAKAWEYAGRMGITSLTESDNNAQTGVIGGLEYGVSVEELTNAYSTIANKGVFNDAYMIRKIEDAEGNIVYEHELAPSVAFSEETAYLMTDMMRTVITAGTATDLLKKYEHRKEVPIVGKTGSTQGDADAWFMGYSPDITVGVWAGYDQPVHKLSSKTGGTMRAKNIWAMVMNGAFEKKPELFPTKEFTKPDNIISMTVSDVSGKLPSELVKQTKHLVTDLFNKKFIPTEEDDTLVKMSVVSFNDFNYIPQPTTPPDMIREKLLIRRDVPVQSIINQIKELFEKNPGSIPTKRGGVKKTPADYYPAGMENEAPTEMDPRVDDGMQPNAPTGVGLTKDTNGFKISFKPSDNEDVAGYRIYHSINGSPFARIEGKVVVTGQKPELLEAGSPDKLYGYYLTSVDIAGRESVPSQVVFSDGTTLDPGTGILPPISGSESGTSTPAASAPPSAPSGVTVSPRDGGVGIAMAWSPNPELESIERYDVYFSFKKDGLYNLIGSPGTTTQFEYISFPIEGWYRVIAVNSVGQSQPSASVQYLEE